MVDRKEDEPVRLQELKQVVENQHYDVEELAGLLELTVDDLLDRFPDKLVENQEKFGVNEDSDE
jgi:hypothetical protein